MQRSGGAFPIRPPDVSRRRSPVLYLPPFSRKGIRGFRRFPRDTSNGGAELRGRRREAAVPRICSGHIWGFA